MTKLQELERELRDQEWLLEREISYGNHLISEEMDTSHSFETSDKIQKRIKQLEEEIKTEKARLLKEAEDNFLTDLDDLDF